MIDRRSTGKAKLFWTIKVLSSLGPLKIFENPHQARRRFLVNFVNIGRVASAQNSQGGIYYFSFLGLLSIKICLEQTSFFKAIAD